MGAMKNLVESSDTRRENASVLRDEAGGVAAFAQKIKRESTQVSRFLGKNPTKNIGDRMARHIEECFGKPRGWLDTPPGYSPPVAASLVSNVTAVASRDGACPEISWVQAGAWTEVCHIETNPEDITWHPRPLNASDQTFVLRVVGESMLPEYPPGTLIYVDPERSPENGKDVVAVMTDTGEATFKRLIEEPGDGRMLKALNPSWGEPYIPINGNCKIIGVVIADMRIRG